MALLLVAAVPVWGQSWAGRGRLQGFVKDENNKPIQGATVTLRMGTDRVDPKADGPKSITTNKNGQWSILGLAGGPWGILIEKEGYMLSEGQASVAEYGAPPQPITVKLKPIEQAAPQPAAASAEPTAAALAKDALERGNTLLGENKFAEARAAYEEGMAKLADQADPVLNASILRSIAMTYYREKKTEQAIDSLKKSLALAPDDPDTLRLIVSLLVEANREPEAQVYMAKLPQGATVDPNTIMNLGIKAYNDGKMDDALRHFDRVVKENPQVADAYYFRGLVYLNQSKNAEAKADFQKLLSLDPNHQYAGDAKEFLKSLQ
jgi:tetratricopeptide (TPR) repeat protein